MYAMVNVQQYQIVVAADSLEECERRYIEKMNSAGITE
jgi:hypothetical protein